MARARTPRPTPKASTTAQPVDAATIERIVDLVRFGRAITRNGDIEFIDAVLAGMLDVVNRAWPPAIPAAIVRAIAAHVNATPSPSAASTTTSRGAARTEAD